MTYNQKIPPFKWFVLENFPIKLILTQIINFLNLIKLIKINDVNSKIYKILNNK